jgi:hypothetical protein
MNQFHFLRNGNKVFYISAVFSVLIGLGFLLIPRYCIYASSYIEKPETNTIVEISEEKPIEVENIDSWIKNNMEKSINFYTEHLTNDTQVSKAIINNSLKNDLPVNLAFSV